MIPSSAVSFAKQTTLGNKVSCSGIGLHSGSQVNMVIYPSAPNTGIVFKRMDLPAKEALIPARFNAVCESRLGTTLANRYGVTVATVEHLMAAFWGIGIDNAIVELDGPEVPIMDGSSEPFVFMLECAGVVEMAAPRRILRIRKAVEVRAGNSVARVEPNCEGDEGCILGIEITFDSKLIDHQASQYDFRETTFKKSLSRARTFGFEHEVKAMREMGLALGGSLENAVVVGKDRILNEDGLRYDDEFVRHKALDCLGDLYLAGHRIDGRFTFIRPGHAINNALLHALFANKSAYAIEESGHMEPALPFFAPQIPAYA